MANNLVEPMVMLTLPTLMKINYDTHITAIKEKKEQEQEKEDEDPMDEDTVIFLTHV